MSFHFRVHLLSKLLLISLVFVVVEGHKTAGGSMSSPLPATKVFLGKPCHRSARQALFTAFKEKRGDDSSFKFKELILTGEFQDKEDKPVKYIDILDQLCIPVGADGSIDVLKFECIQETGFDARKSICGCGYWMNSVDPNLSTTIEEEMVVYSSVYRLNRRLTLRQGLEPTDSNSNSSSSGDDDLGRCFSGGKGHCSDTAPKPMRCVEPFQCHHLKVKDGSVFRNSQTGLVYGVCRVDKGLRTEKKGEDDENGAARVGKSKWSLILAGIVLLGNIYPFMIKR